MQYSNLIGVYENALSPEFCQECIKVFEKSQQKRAGQTGQGVDKEKKNSIDITITDYNKEWNRQIQEISLVLVRHLIEYVRSYPFLLSGAISLLKPDTKGKMVPITHEDIAKMPDEELSVYLTQVYNFGSINIQKYLKGEGGYFHWHSEIFPSPYDTNQSSLHRVLLWMYYLNDVEEGGETEFYYQEASLKPKQGTLVIAPASFSHTHRGRMPISNDKYIFTSWIQYRPAHELYGQRN